uniref:Uncharacterized protein n=1 Tax=viral metagenome TaxID=1070528 RepID=A0A6C0KN74_9ZZZZ
MRIMYIVHFVMFYLVESVYPGKKWLTICNNSKKWAENKTLSLKTYLQDNLDVLYL